VNFGFQNCLHIQGIAGSLLRSKWKVSLVDLYLLGCCKQCYSTACSFGSRTDLGPLTGTFTLGFRASLQGKDGDHCFVFAVEKPNVGDPQELVIQFGGGTQCDWWQKYCKSRYRAGLPWPCAVPLHLEAALCWHAIDAMIASCTKSNCIRNLCRADEWQADVLEEGYSTSNHDTASTCFFRNR
jgi:hypothetical protein